MLPREETPLERIEADIAWLKGLPDIVVSTVRPQGQLRLGPWAALQESMKDNLLHDLDWSGVDADDYQRIMAREVKPYDIFESFCRKGEQCD
jgi:hypothetical protein